MYPFGNAIGSYYPPQGPTDITALSVGDTVIAGTTIVDDSKVRKVPILYHPEYLLDYFNDMSLSDFADAIITGTVKTPIERITSGSISKEGTAQGFNGPGVLAVENNKLIVNPPEAFVYGYKTPYTFGVKTKDGLQIVEGKNVLKVVPYDQISNNTIPHNYMSINNVKEWYKSANTGDRITLDYAIAGFNDGRNLITPEDITTFFGSNVLTYMENYPSGRPILVYAASTTQQVIGTGDDVVGSYAEYNNTERVYNSGEFVQAWNGTIIPPHATSSGKETVGFERVADPTAPGGWASHGACPPARALRAASFEAGFGMPHGLQSGEFAMMMGYNPATDVTITNTKDYPVEILMWTTGSGTSMGVHAKIIALMPQ
jgi:hypothetical protein